NTILNNLDKSVDPCDDFYQFSCGSFIKTSRIPDEKTKIDVFDILRNDLVYMVSDILSEEINDDDIKSTENAKKLYQSCINEESFQLNGEKKFLEVLDSEFCGWPILKPLNKSISILQRMVNFRKIGYKTLIDFHVTLNPKDPLSLIIKVQQPRWLFNKEYYNDSNFVKVYKQYIIKYVTYLNNSAERISESVDRMLEIEKTIAMKLVNEDQKRNSSYKNTTIRGLIKQIPDFNWREYIIEGIFSEVNNVTINDTEPIIVDDFEYLSFISDFINKADVLYKKSDLENLMVWSAIKNEVTSLPKKYMYAKQEFDKVYKGTKSSHPRAVTCSSYVLDVMEFAVGRLYVMRYFNNHSKQAASEMIENIRVEFMQILRETDWLDDQSRNLALAKAENIDSKVGYPDFIYNSTHLNELYSKYVMNENEYLQNSLKILKIDALSGFNELRIKRDRKQWISGPAVVNAFYSPYANQICFPAGILQAPFYDADYPNYLNYGGIGSVIGHEITHGFDDRGRMHDKNGVYYADGVSSLWTNNTVYKYKEKVQCIIDQYNNFIVKQINKTLNGFMTQGENIADNGGIKESFRAYKNWVKKNGPEPLLPGLDFNQEQLFFINYAQVWCTKYRSQSLLNRVLNSNHSPGEFRIIGPTSNSKNFAEVFKCKLGQANNPIKKCSVW
ncbi:membrane metallo-endopeptidase-like 1, partial [Brachionus plicatilis]